MLRDSNATPGSYETSAANTLERTVDLDAVVRAVIEAVPSAAFVVSMDGSVLYANATGKKMLAANRSRTTSELARAIEGEVPAWEVKRIAGRTRAELHHLLVHRDAAVRVSTRVNEAVVRWKLSRRQADVLALVIDGHPNASIAMILGIATRTVEVHVSALLDRLQVENRSALVARVLSP